MVINILSAHNFVDLQNRKILPQKFLFKGKNHLTLKILVLKNFRIYCRQGKLYWAKLLQFWPYEVFYGNIFAVHIGQECSHL